MPGLPVSVRCALWVSDALTIDARGPSARKRTVERALARIAPDVDHLLAPVETVAAWAELDERALFVALPRPGDTTGLPRGSAGREYAAFADAALIAGEAVIAPSLGAAIVPRFARFGPAGDEGEELRWQTFSCPPVTVVDAQRLSVRESSRELRTAVLEIGAVLGSLDSPQWASRELREELDDDARRGVWALPDWIYQGERRAILEAGRMAEIAAFALDRLEATHSLGVLHEQRAALRQLAAAADRALSVATNVATARRAGWLPAGAG